MGFGELLSFRVDGIPAKLGHYVVDRFDPRKMEIKVPCGKIKVDKEAIHKLLGLPCGGIQLDSVTALDTLDDNVRKWKNQNPGGFIAPSQIVNRIENSDDEDNFNFRLDFLMLFLAIMVGCSTQGRCKLKVLKHLRGDIEFNEIDWCSYIAESMKTCKKGWIRCDYNSPFVGPLTILTLLYVKNVECKGMNVDETVNAITFWNMNRLKIREKLEIKGGGFGKGKFKGFSLVMNNPSQEDAQHIRGNNFSDEMSEVKKQLEVMVKNMKKVEETLCQIYEIYPENKEVLTLMARYESLLEDKPTWPPKPKEESMETHANILYALAGIGEQVNTDEKRSDDECSDEIHDSGETNTNEERIEVAKFITDFMQFKKSSVGGDEAGAEIVIDQDKKAESTKANQLVDDKNGLENSVDDNMEHDMIREKDKANAIEGVINTDVIETPGEGLGAAKGMTKLEFDDQSSISLGLCS